MQVHKKGESPGGVILLFFVDFGGVCRRLVVYAVVAEHSFDFLEYFVDAE